MTRKMNLTELLGVNDAAWAQQATCRTAPDPDLWFTSDVPGSHAYTQARRICRDCPVQAECLAFALERREPFGVWAGTTPRQRREMRAGRRIA